MKAHIAIRELYPEGDAFGPVNCLIRIYPCTLHDPERLHMPVGSFFDGSNRRTLAGICAEETAWAEFDIAWKAMLEKYGILEHGLHVADMMAARPRPPYEGWSEAKKYEIINAGLDCFEKMGLRLRSCICSVDMNDHRRLKAENPILISEHSICVHTVFNGCVHHSGDHARQDQKVITLYFDRTEAFMKKISKVWQYNRSRYRNGWMGQINDIISVSHKQYFAIQGADLLAWIVAERLLAELENRK